MQPAESLFGLILAGGKSRRMGIDKATLRYHAKSQIEYCFELLSPFCCKVFLSNRKEQTILAEYKKFPQIHDIYSDVGPLGGILSAMAAYPRVAWLVLACDLPYVHHATIETLIKKRNPAKMATAYMANNLPEPLCAIYESKISDNLLGYFKKGCRSVQTILSLLDVECLKPKESIFLHNVNYPEEYIQTVNFLSRREGVLAKNKRV